MLAWETLTQCMLLFLHGAGGFDEDGFLANCLAEASHERLIMPQLPDEDMSFEAWAAPVRIALGELRSDDLVIGYSFGASILVKVLAERDWLVQRAVLLAIPNWGPDGWDVAEYDLDQPVPQQTLALHHCADDAVVPPAHLALSSAHRPAAERHGQDVHARWSPVRRAGRGVAFVAETLAKAA